MRRTADEIADELLVLGSQAGDADAWKLLVQRWHPRLFAQAKRVSGTTDGAADITQEAWLAIIRSIRRLDDPARFRPWAHRIVANKAADWMRRRHRDRQLVQSVANDKPPVDADSSQDRETIRREQVNLVRKAIRQLPSEQRLLLALFYSEGRSIREISHRLSIPVGTVKSRLHSIRKELKSLLENLQL